MVSSYLVVFVVSVLCISLELFLTRILNLKAWNHVVYIIIPFAILGYGIGANLCLIFRNYFLKRWESRRLVAACLLFIALFSLLSSLILVELPLNVTYLVNLFVNIHAVGMLLLAYTILMVPFVLIGFLVVYLFLQNPTSNHTLYFFDLAGAGLGAFLFYPLINSFAVFHSLILLSLCALMCAALFLSGRVRVPAMILVALCGCFLFKNFPEPSVYSIDPSKGWEYIPGYYKPDQYQRMVSRWHPMGRTEIFRILGKKAIEQMYHDSTGTFEINLSPLPEFSYISTNYLAGTPIYKMSMEGLAERNSEVKLFSQAMEFPYTLSPKNKVLVIGAGGGRDIFMAKSHGVKEVIGAEINPGVYAEMSPGGKYYDYSGQVYTHDGTRIWNLDGRQIVKRQPSDSIDLIILNGVDTFSGLSTGAYAYAESYLYTKDAIVDYLRVLKNDGVINFNRWFNMPPREDLRLFAIALEALKISGAEHPGDHIILGSHERWALMLIKKTPFTPQERDTIKNYFASHNTELIYPDGKTEIAHILKDPADFYNLYLANFNQGTESLFVDNYMYDVSVVSDDNPFFYKFYKLSSFNPFDVLSAHHTGTVIFMTQIVIFLQALIFILIFIFLPLFIFKKNDIKALPRRARSSFILYFGCLGAGFMLIEIPLMQRFVLLLGSPIYSLSATLAILLLATGIGSFLTPHFQKVFKTRENVLLGANFLILFAIVVLALTGSGSLDRFVGLSLTGRILVVAVILTPLGILLGTFFPSGLEVVNRDFPEAVPWAWGINSGFSVLGSILSIIFAQFFGFHTILLMAAIIYLVAVLSYQKMTAALNEEKQISSNLIS